MLIFEVIELIKSSQNQQNPSWSTVLPHLLTILNVQIIPIKTTKNSIIEMDMKSYTVIFEQISILSYS